MLMSVLWDTIFEMNDQYPDAEVFLLDNYIPALRFGKADKPTVFAAGFGAEQWQCSALLLTFFDKLLYDVHHAKNMAGIAVKKALKKRSVVVVPAVCPPKLGEEQDRMSMKDFMPFAKYLNFHQPGMLMAVESGKESLFSPAANGALATDTGTIFQILRACSKLPASDNADTYAAKVCEWASEEAGLPAFSLSPGTVKASSIPQVYRMLEETFAVSALL